MNVMLYVYVTETSCWSAPNDFRLFVSLADSFVTSAWSTLHITNKIYTVDTLSHLPTEKFLIRRLGSAREKRWQMHDRNTTTSSSSSSTNFIATSLKENSYKLLASTHPMTTEWCEWLAKSVSELAGRWALITVLLMMFSVTLADHRGKKINTTHGQWTKKDSTKYEMTTSGKQRSIVQLSRAGQFRELHKPVAAYFGLTTHIHSQIH